MIRVLSESVHSKIAAGEVIDRPAAIVRELIDNAIDAKATKIDIYLHDGGISRITIIDNGNGMSKEDLALSTFKHSTSKIESIDDLYKIKSMGFRGEALYSIKTVSQLTITTSNDKSGTRPGYALRYENETPIIEETACKKGTTIDINNLFFNLPARKKFLKSTVSEFNACRQTVIEKIFSSLNIAYSLYNENKLIIRTTGNGNFSEAFFTIYKNETPTQIYNHIIQNNKKIKLTVYHSEKDIFHNTRKFQQFYVNNRPVSCSFFYSAVSNGYQNFISPGRHPIIFIYLDISPDLIDVNIHPAKREIKFYDQQEIFSIISQAVKEAYSNLLKDSLTDSKPLDYSTFFSSPSRSIVSENSFLQQDNDDRNVLEMYKTQKEFINQQSTPITFSNDIPETDIKILGTAFRTYLTVEKNDSLFFIDQHALEEAYIFKKKKEHYTKDPSLMPLLIPSIITISNYNDYIDHKIEMLKNEGFEIENNEGDSFTLRTIPSVLHNFSNDEAALLITEWLEEASMPHHSPIDDLLISFSCREAIKKGDKLTPLEIHNLVKIFFDESITNCPHGRPVYFMISKDMFEKNFQRKK